MKDSAEEIKNFEKFLKKQNISERSLNFYASDIRVFIRWAKNTLGVSEISEEVFENYAHYLKYSGLPVKTINRKLSSLRKYQSFLISSGAKGGDLKIRNYSSKKNTQASLVASVITSVAPSATLFVSIVILGILILNLNKKEIYSLSDLTNKNFLENIDYANNTPIIITPTGGTALSSDGLQSGGRKILFAGKDQIDKQKASKTIYLPSVSSSSLIFITPNTNIASSYIYVSSQKEGEFTVSVSDPNASDIKFSWLAVSSELPIDTDY